ncbi:MAG: multidrug ABC transporter ATP-binding protein [Omnitrophica WOR_2 bacterium SM23_29]|nr:MAG: multidrug ABC transporter ATP-binding protein [Omnitrophica WOR_2 bacterium SM23_29]
MNEIAVRVKNLSKHFEQVLAVDNISFEVERAEIFGFLGPNGAGKTTTINILCTLLMPTCGEAIVNGFNVITSPNEVRKSIGIIFQDPSLDERLTAYENLNFHGMIYHLPSTARKGRIEEVLNMVGLYSKRDCIVRTFSGGMKRRLEIARGLMHKPKILFLDEPTIGLDPQTRQYIWDYILNLSQREKITIFLTTHYMDEAEICQRVGIIDHGKIVALDTPRALKNKYATSSLNDVFLEITGRDIREEESDSKERLSRFLRSRRLR